MNRHCLARCTQLFCFCLSLVGHAATDMLRVPPAELRGARGVTATEPLA